MKKIGLIISILMLFAMATMAQSGTNSHYLSGGDIYTAGDTTIIIGGITYVINRGDRAWSESPRVLTPRRKHNIFHVWADTVIYSDPSLRPGYLYPAPTLTGQDTAYSSVAGNIPFDPYYSDSVNNVFTNNGHKFSYDYHNLADTAATGQFYVAWDYDHDVNFSACAIIDSLTVHVVGTSNAAYGQGAGDQIGNGLAVYINGSELNLVSNDVISGSHGSGTWNFNVKYELQQQISDLTDLKVLFIWWAGHDTSLLKEKFSIDHITVTPNFACQDGIYVLNINSDGKLQQQKIEIEGGANLTLNDVAGNGNTTEVDLHQAGSGSKQVNLSDGELSETGSGGQTATIKADNISGSRTHQLPDASGTYVLTVDGNSPDNQGNVNSDGGGGGTTITGNQNQIVYKNTDNDYVTDDNLQWYSESRAFGCGDMVQQKNQTTFLVDDGQKIIQSHGLFPYVQTIDYNGTGSEEFSDSLYVEPQNIDTTFAEYHIEIIDTAYQIINLANFADVQVGDIIIDDDDLIQSATIYKNIGGNAWFVKLNNGYENNLEGGNGTNQRTMESQEYGHGAAFDLLVWIDTTDGGSIRDTAGTNGFSMTHSISVAPVNYVLSGGHNIGDTWDFSINTVGMYGMMMRYGDGVFSFGDANGNIFTTRLRIDVRKNKIYLDGGTIVANSLVSDESHAIVSGGGGELMVGPEILAHDDVVILCDSVLDDYAPSLPTLAEVTLQDSLSNSRIDIDIKGNTAMDFTYYGGFVGGIYYSAAQGLGYLAKIRTSDNNNDSISTEYGVNSINITKSPAATKVLYLPEFVTGDTLATTSQLPHSGTYIPTITPTGNLDSIQSAQFHYTVIGNLVTVVGKIKVYLTNPWPFYYNISLPIAGTFSDIYDIMGNAIGKDSQTIGEVQWGANDLEASVATENTSGSTGGPYYVNINFSYTITP